MGKEHRLQTFRSMVKIMDGGASLTKKITAWWMKSLQNYRKKLHKFI
jgi:hypothetical protein